MFFSARGQFSWHCFLRSLSFPLRSFLVWCSWTDRIHVGSLLGSLCHPRVHVSVFLPGPHCGVFLPLCDVVWSWRGRCIQLCSSFSESFWLFKFLFNIISLILGIFLFLWKMPLYIILWLQSVYLLMVLGGMDLLIPHCSSAWAWIVFCLFVFSLVFFNQCFLVFWLLVFYVLD